MSGLLPANTTIQLSNNDGDIAHQGILASNVSGTTFLTSTFPTTSTGTSLGHYHYTEDTTNSLKFLNASGLGGGGHQFWHSSSTETPLKTLEINRIGVITSTNFSVDKSIQGGTTLVNLPPIIVGQPTQVVFNYPPGLDSFGIQFGVYDNPVQVLFNAGVFVTGVTYYAQATNAQTLTIRTTSNPSDPPLDCSVFTNGQIPFAFVSSSTPSSLQTAVLSDNLTITDDNNSSILSTTSLRNSTNKTILDMNSNELALIDPTTANYTSTLNGYNLIVSDGSNASYIRGANIATGSSAISSTLTSVDLRIENNTLNLQSILSSTDLLFNNVSLPARVTATEGEIDILQIKQTNTIQVYSSPAIYADGRPPLPVPSASSNTYAQFGWYFKNTTAGWKINWYQPPATGMLVSDILGLYLRFFNCSTTSNDNSPFLTILTTPTGSGDFFPGFFHSSMTYILDATPVANTSYTMFMNVTGSCPNPSSYASNLVPMEISPVNNPRGVYAPTDSVLAIVIGSNSASPVNSVEFIAQKLGVMTASGTQELLYQTLL